MKKMALRERDKGMGSPVNKEGGVKKLGWWQLIIRTNTGQSPYGQNGDLIAITWTLWARISTSNGELTTYGGGSSKQGYEDKEIQDFLKNRQKLAEMENLR